MMSDEEINEIKKLVENFQDRGRRAVQRGWI